MRRRDFAPWFVLAGLALMASCQGGKHEEKAIMKEDMDLTVDPGTDFYRYSNGGWISRTKIPDDKTRYGAFDILAEETERKVKDIVYDAWNRKGDTTDAEWIKLGNFFAAGMDTATIDAMGYEPIKPDLDNIAMVAKPEDVVRQLARLCPLGCRIPFYITVQEDSRDVTQMSLSIYQAGLGMPDRDYYLDSGADYERIRAAYISMLEGFMRVQGYEEAAAKEVARDVFEFEKRLAKGSMTRVERRDPIRTYNKLTLEELQKLTPNFDWSLYFQNMGIEIPKTLIVDSPSFLELVNRELVATPINVWKDYMSLQLMTDYSGVLSSEIDQLSFEFYGKTLSGQPVQRARWKRVLSVTQSALGEAIGREYVAKYFPPESKNRMEGIVENLRSTLRETILGLEWMSDSTKERAVAKLDAMGLKIGYPSKWKDYSDLTVSRDRYALNVRNARIFEFNEEMSKLGKPVDKEEWFMYPQTVNAYYSPTRNEIVFPAAILQPPFFYPNGDDAVNYGAIGVVIGHEITHGFDDQGRMYNKDGNLENWWTDGDALRFKELTQLVVEQYNGFVLEGEHVNGSLTLGENLADYGGLSIAYRALEKALKAKGESVQSPLIDGFTPQQRFFLAYSKVWRNVVRPEESKRRLKTDVHSPGEFRVNGAVYNIPAFYEAFKVPEDGPYYRSPAQRPTIW